MKFLSGDAYLGSEAELGTIGECRRYIGIHTCCIDLCEEFLGCLAVFGDDALRVM